MVDTIQSVRKESTVGKTAIVTGGTHKDVSAIGVLALNLKDILSDFVDELVIFHDGISKREQHLILEIFPSRFYDFKFKIRHKDMRANRSLRYFSPMVFCKYECFRLLAEYERVIWLDYDIVIRKDFSELFESSTGLKLIVDGAMLRQMFLDDAECIDGQGYDLNGKAFTTSFFVLTRQIGDYQRYYEWCRKETLQYAAHIDLPEQCIIAMLVQKFHLAYEELTQLLHPNSDDGTAAVLHASGRPKFWEGLHNDMWDRYYREWLSIGGSPYRKPLKEKIIDVKERCLRR